MVLAGEEDEVKLSAFEKDKEAVFEAIDAVVTYSDATPSLWDELPVNFHCGISTQFLKSEADAKSRSYTETAWWKDVASCLFGE